MKTVITVLGQDRPGIIANVSTKLYELNINILDVSQTIMDGYFTMTMLVDTSESTKPFDEAKADIIGKGEENNVILRMQRVDIFNAMHKL